MEQMNSNVTLRGIIDSELIHTHSVHDEAFYEFNLKVPRLSETSDILPVTISERLITGLDLAVGAELAVAGQFRSYNKLVEGRSKLLLTVFVTEILDNQSIINPNSIELKGHICKLPVYRVTPFNREICDVLLAVNRAYNKSDYIPCIAWGRNAKFIRNAPVGTKLEVFGRIQSRPYQKKLSETEFETRMAYEVSISKLHTEDTLLFDQTLAEK